jgi:hypothetical protein
MHISKRRGSVHHAGISKDWDFEKRAISMCFKRKALPTDRVTDDRVDLFSRLSLCSSTNKCLSQSNNSVYDLRADPSTSHTHEKESYNSVSEQSIGSSSLISKICIFQLTFPVVGHARPTSDRQKIFITIHCVYTLSKLFKIWRAFYQVCQNYKNRSRKIYALRSSSIGKRHL